MIKTIEQNNMDTPYSMVFFTTVLQEYLVRYHAYWGWIKMDDLKSDYTTGCWLFGVRYGFARGGPVLGSHLQIYMVYVWGERMHPKN